MNKVGFSTRTELIFWASLLGYCLVFFVFYLNTQYAFKKLDEEMIAGSLSSIPDEACMLMKGCKSASLSPFLFLNKETNKYSIQFEIETKAQNTVNQSVLDRLFEEKRKNLPWYVDNKLDSIVIASINNEPVKSHPDNRANWYKDMLNKLGL